MNKKKFILITVDFILLFIIIFLFLKIKICIQKNEQGVSLIKLDQKYFKFSSHNYLKYFYEPEVNTIKNFYPEWLGYSVYNFLNYDSLNERFNYEINKKNNTYRITTMGDSFTYGFGVNTTDNYPELLENYFNTRLDCLNYKNFEVINLGVPGYDIEYTVERFIKRGKKYDPDLTIWLINNWNFQNLNEFIIPFEEKKIKEGKAVNSLETIEKLNKEIGVENIYDENKKNFKKLIDVYKKKILIISFPTLDEKYEKIINDFVLKLSPNNIYYLKMPDLEGKSGFVLSDEIHPNEKAYKIISENIADYLFKKYLNVNCTLHITKIRK